jgi:hypothetical protein
MYEEYVSLRVLVRFFLSPVAAVFFPAASFFSTGAFWAGALVAGFFSAAAPFGGIFESRLGGFGFNFEGEVEMRQIKLRDTM